MDAPVRSGGAGVSPVVIVGAGPVGLTLALRLAAFGVDSVVVEANPRLRGEGSKALCMQKETLESWARLGFGQQVADRGVSWTLGRTYFRGKELFQHRFPGVGRDHFPPFVNISQTEVEEMMVARCEASPRVSIRWEHRVVGLVQASDHVTVVVETRDGEHLVRGGYVVAADGARSAMRGFCGVDFPGHSHEDKFLIADIRAALSFPDERRFFFDPPWNPGRTVLVHPQPDSVWRIDWQVPPDTDLEEEQASGRLDQRIRQIVGDADYEIVWLTLYRFHQRLAERFSAGRAFLAGDAAHLYSPFGARGLNSGVADAENLAWKFAYVLHGAAPDALLSTYDAERRAAAEENLAVTDATMRFMVPKGHWRRARRNTVLRLSPSVPALRRRVNSGRLAQPHVYQASPIVEPDNGGVAPDGPLTVIVGPLGTWRLRELVDTDVVALLVVPSADTVAAVLAGAHLPGDVPSRLVVVTPDGNGELDLAASLAAADDRIVVAVDDEGVLASAYCADGVPPAGRLFIVRPDGHLAARRDLVRPGNVDVLPSLIRAAAGHRLPVDPDVPAPRRNHEQDDAGQHFAFPANISFRGPQRLEVTWDN